MNETNNFSMVIPAVLQDIISSLNDAGWRTLLAGGGVIDHLLGLAVKDWDIEVYDCSFQQLNATLRKFGNPNLVGRTFGVIKLFADDHEFDFSIPRKDNRIGKGHRDFEIEMMPDLTPLEAARRRDITINSMYVDLVTGEVIDHFGGMNDLKDGRIRATEPATFIEDPLRVLRIMQILPRKGKFVDPDTIALCRSMIDDFETLAKERLFGEFKKLLLDSDSPSSGLNFLADCGWIEKFPELNALRGTEQNPKYHPEGDVWTHTLAVIDNAARLRNELPDEWRTAYMFGMLCHDMGKPITTDPETLTAYRHESEGQEIAAQFMKRITDENGLIDKVKDIVAAHMRPYALYKANASLGAWKRLHNLVPLQILAYVSKADSLGKTGNENAVPAFETCLRLGEEFGRTRIAPILTGKHLIERGHKPSPDFGEILRIAYEYQLDTGCVDADELYEHAMREK